MEEKDIFILDISANYSDLEKILHEIKYSLELQNFEVRKDLNKIYVQKLPHYNVPLRIALYLNRNRKLVLEVKKSKPLEKDFTSSVLNIVESTINKYKEKKFDYYVRKKG